MSGSSTKKLSKFSPNGLLMLFVVAITLVFGGTSMLVVSSQTRQSIEQLQDGNGAFELESARIFIEQYLEVAEDRIVLASQNPLLADALAEKDKANLTYLLDRYRGSNQPILFAARDIDGQIQYEDTFRHPASVQEAVIFEAMANATTDERIVYLLHDDTSHICLKLFMPVKREGQFVGMLYGEVPVDYDEFFGSFINGRERWYELSQDSVGDIIKAEDLDDHYYQHVEHNSTDKSVGSWHTESVNLTKGGLVLTQGLSQSFVNQQIAGIQNDLVKSLLVVVFISSLLVAYLGKKLFINPHYQLERSKRELEDSNQQLSDKERESDLLATVVRATKDSVVITDSNGKIEWVNKAFETMTGYSLDSIVGRSPGSFLQGDGTDPETVGQLNQAIKKGVQHKAEILNYTIDGQPYWVEIDIMPLVNEEGVVERYIAIERDVTELKRLVKEQADATSAANSANEAKSKFLATMSHEIRTPMNGLLGLLQMLEEDIENQEQKKVVSLALGSGEHLVSILNDILDLAKIESDALVLDVQPFKMDDVVNPVMSTYQTLCSEKGLQFVFNNYCPEHSVYSGDSVRIRQVVLNLVGNALKFTEEGAIHVVIEQIAGGKAQFSIKDTGIGIPKDRIETIFDEFEQAEISTNRKYGGTGLGLAICYRLTKLMNGTLEVTSEEGVGSCFTFTIPLPMMMSNSRSTTEHSGVMDFSNYRALVADDNNMNRIIAKGFLDKLGIENETCSNGKEAIELLETGHFNLLIIDNHMPELSGVEAVKQIRDSGIDNLIIFGWTADIMQKSTRSFIEAGADEVLAKPLIKKDLTDALIHYAEKLEVVEKV
ncbi:PAS domain-containing protein [Vibrio astriarenae]|uniref:histidine kinase n=2 Tax=Vibrio astriarenae TaxID=1481923 RepID=A0A7Z2T6B6_9VIBR|nr:PAS domain-containing protein [Vibrio astriarenae]